MDATEQHTAYEPFKPRHALQLAAPHTWAASVTPVLISCALALHVTDTLDILMAFMLLAICVLMQSSVNTFNDYFDFIKGTDTEADVLEADDSTLVNDRVNPRCALIFAIALLVAAFLLGIFIIWQCGFIPLIIALIGALAVVLYSGGRTPLSSLPVGELVSGFVMGGLIPLACCYCLTGQLDFLVLVFSIPLIIGIGLIMMTNNTCDTEKDEEAGRRTLPVLLGHTRARAVYRGAVVAWVVAICVICATWFPSGAIWLPFMVLCAFPLCKGAWKNPLTQQSRIAAMAAIISLNVALGAFYALCIISG